ncbi:MAG: hypothetical protein ACM3SU_15385 [Acidobacteriota bacterium]
MPPFTRISVRGNSSRVVAMVEGQGLPAASVALALLLRPMPEEARK